MSEIITTPQAEDSRRAQRTVARLSGMSRAEVEAMMRDGARMIAEALVQHGIPKPSRRFRPDVGPVQIDMIVISEKVSQPEPGMRLQFEVEGNMGVTFNIKLLEFVRDPAGYVRDLFEHLGPMRRNVQRMRTNKRELNARIYGALTQGGAHA